MKVGDLVKWTHPHFPCFGIVRGDPRDTWMGNEVDIFWFEEDKDTSGLYPIDHEFLELVNESG